MSNQTLQLTPSVINYLHSVGFRENPVLTELRAFTKHHAAGAMQISPEQGQLMNLFTRLLNAKRCIEIGVFTGYSASSVALALPKDGELVACNISTEYTDQAKPFWEKAGVQNIINLHIAPASETLQTLIDDGQLNTFDMAFIDADKTGYDMYYEQCLQLVRPGGLILIDNVLWSGQVALENPTSEDTVALKALNQKTHQDDRVDMLLIPISDGLTLTIKR